MPFQPQHIGLYFGQAEIDNAKSQRETNKDLQTAWQWLLASAGDVIKEHKPKEKDAEPEQVTKAQLTASGQLIEAAFRYRFADNEEAGQYAARVLNAGFGLTDQATLYETITNTLTAAHAFEMLRDVMNANWLQSFISYSDSLLQAYDDASHTEQLWLITLQLVTGVLADDQARFDAAVTKFYRVIDEDIHPEGYIKPVVKDVEESEIAFVGMVNACAALTLASEAATQAGVNLWQYENRDVGLNTAITYLVYYYFYPAKWRWGEDELTEEQTETIFSQIGAWIDIATYRVNPRGVELLLEDQRPFFNPYMGGLTTLSHSKTEKRKRRGIFR